ncbi:xylulokinase [Microbacterium aurantiacum]|uniref:Xylulose kinase n=1 Tax=Microbacterium aurantiacum TaxID=162393 RepID=A0ABT8FWF0_9MICO|nr:xylulokinase [Microbacterium aurantiacum]MDN4465643.1 xylulokinase [Microbacterium aurantiacum]
MSVVAGVDSSTQSTKVVLRDADTGVLVGQGRSPHPPTFPPRSEQHPDDWWRAFTAAFAAAVDDAGVSAREVRAISIAAQCHGLVALDDTDRVIRPAKLWNDTTTAPQMAALRERMPAAEWARRIGSVPTAAFTVSKLSWLRETEPESYARLARVLLPHDWLTLCLTGRAVTDRSDASGTGYFDSVANRYDDEILALVDPGRDLRSMLPEVLGPDEPAGEVRDAVRRELGLDPGVLVAAGAGDQHASALGLGIQAGELVVSLGTSGVVYTVSARRPADPTGMVDGVADAAGGFLPLVSTLNAAKVTDTAARWLGVDHDELGRLALAAPLAEDRPVFAAFLDGERKPDRPGARGLLAGLSTETTREQLALAAFEGVVFGLVRGQHALERAGVDCAGPLLAVGGAAASPAARQVLADATGRTVLTTAMPEAVASGAAVQAAAVLAGRTIAEVRSAWAPPRTAVAEPMPRPEDGAFERYAALADWTGMDS